MSVLKGHDEPSVGLLNIGEEAIKGSDIIKQAGELLRSAAAAGDLNFFGNVEGNDIYKGTVDIVVCDGFVGNVALKASEGVASMIGEFMKAEFSHKPLDQVGRGVCCLSGAAGAETPPGPPALHTVRPCVGLRGLVFKSHGSADSFAFEQALNRGYDAARNKLLDRVQARIAHALPLLTAVESAPTAAAETAVH